MKYIFLIRHGYTDMCQVKKEVGQNRDVSLNIIGRQQIMLLTSYLSLYNIKQIYVSPLKRTIESLNIIINKLDCSPNIIRDKRVLNKEEYKGEYKKNIISLLYEIKEISGNIIIITHGRIIKMIRKYIETNDIPDIIPKNKWCKYGSISCIEHKNNKFIGKYYGKIDKIPLL